MEFYKVYVTEICSIFGIKIEFNLLRVKLLTNTKLIFSPEDFPIIGDRRIEFHNF